MFGKVLEKSKIHGVYHHPPCHPCPTAAQRIQDIVCSTLMAFQNLTSLHWLYMGDSHPGRHGQCRGTSKMKGCCRCERWRTQGSKWRRSTSWLARRCAWLMWNCVLAYSRSPPHNSMNRLRISQRVVCDTNTWSIGS